MPAAPPPPQPQHAMVAAKETNVEMHEQLATQRVERKSALAIHKATAMRVAESVEDINAKTPEHPVKLPTKMELAEMTGTESDESDSIASAVMDPSASHQDYDPVDDGFAALRAQRAQRKKLVREHKQTSAGVQIEASRARSGKFFRNGVDAGQ